MKYQVKVQGKLFEVEIEDLQKQPVVAIVEGEVIEVWVQKNQNSPKSTPVGNVQKAEASLKASAPASKHGGMRGYQPSSSNKSIKAPIPGTILSIAVAPGCEVEIGQDLCVLEAMKMKNSIRSPRKGTIETILVSPGQTVNHHDSLMEFTE